MKLFGTIAEYNPFHNGHKYCLNEMRKSGATHIVVVISGNFVQRGEPAIFEKHERAKSALENGVDLVVELPTMFSISTAQKFAEAGIKLLDAINIDTLCFGSESGNINALYETADTLNSESFEKLLLNELKSGCTYANARENALCKISPHLAEIIKNPNDILGIEYISAIKKFKSDINVLTVKRNNCQHNSDIIFGNFASASEIRRRIYSNENYSDFVPEIYDLTPFDYSHFETAVLYKLRTMSTEEISKLPDISEGLENRIFDAIKTATSLDELYSLIKTKRYAHSRIRRIILSAFLQIEKNDYQPQYIKVLGFNEKGREILKSLRNTAKLPVIMKYSDVTDDIKNQYMIENRCTDIYSLFNNRPCSCEMTDNPVIL